MLEKVTDFKLSQLKFSFSMTKNVNVKLVIVYIEVFVKIVGVENFAV